MVPKSMFDRLSDIEKFLAIADAGSLHEVLWSQSDADISCESFINYTWNERNFGRMMMNSLLVSSTVTLSTVITSAYIAYVFRFRFRMPLLYVVIATTMVPLPVLVLPHFQMVNWLGWLNTYQALIVPYALWGFGVFLMYQFLASFPKRLIEAA